MSDFEKKYYDLLNTVAEMRKWQKEAARFHYRNSDSLRKSKARERIIDDLLIAEAGKLLNLQKSMF